MKRGAYRDNDYGFGQTMLSLRSAMGLTQAALAENLGVSRQSVAEWEAGSKYPKFNRLQAFIALAVQYQALTVGREAEEIRALWKASHQKVLLDETWLAELLLPEAQQKTDFVRPSAGVNRSRFHWDDALAVDTFYGREWELNLLREWMVEQSCRIITLLGLGGIGKSALAIHLMHQLANDFEVVIWRSLRDLPTCDVLMADLLQILAPHSLGETTDTFEQRLAILMEHLRATRVLLVLDNVESVFEEGEISGRVRPGYEGFGRFLRQAAETRHQCSVILTSRQKPDDLLPHEGTHAPVRTLRLAALDADACEQLLTEREVVGNPTERNRLIEAYAGNPLALKIVAQTISDLFGGEIGPFLEQGGVVFGGVHELLHAQYIRLSPLEQRIVFWLAIMREPLNLQDLQSLFVVPLSPAKALETMNGLHRHSLIERGQASGSFTLQSVVLEYLTEQLITEASQEIERGELTILLQHGLELSQVKDFVRQTQTRLLINPLLLQLQSIGLPHLETHLVRLLDTLRQIPLSGQGYGPANLIALLKLLRGHLRGLDLSGLALRGVNLQGVEMQDTRLAGAVMQGCDFTEMFDGINTLTISANGQYWAASSNTGEVRLWETEGHTLRHIWPSTADIIFRIALSPDGQKFAGGTLDGLLKVWDTSSGTLLWTINWPESVSMIYRMVFSPDASLLICIGDDNLIRLLNARNGIQLQTVPLPQPVSFAVWSPDGSMLAIGDRAGVIGFWARNQTDENEPLVYMQSITAYQQMVTGISFSPDATMMGTSSFDGVGKLWDLTTGQVIHTFTEPVIYMRFSPDGSLLTMIGREQVIWVWDVAHGTYQMALRGHKAQISNWGFLPDGNTIISGSRDGMVRIWDVKTGECLHVIWGYAASLNDIDWSPDSQQLVSSGEDHRVTVYSLNPTVSPRPLRGHDATIYSIDWSRDGKWLASAQRDCIRLWDAKTGECLRVIQHPDTRHNLFYCLEWSPDGQHLAVGTAWRGLMIWDVHTQQFRWSHDNFPTVIGGRVAWNLDGTQILTRGHNRVVYLWNMEGQVTHEFVGHQAQLISVGLSPDSQQIVSMSTTEIMVWDVRSGEQLLMIEEPSRKFSEVTWGTEGHVITGSTDGKLRWWDIQTGECFLVHDAHEGAVQSLRKSPDRTKLASCGNDGAVKVWDLHTGEHLQTLRRDRPYERLDITGIQGLTEAQKMNLRALGAIEYNLA